MLIQRMMSQLSLSNELSPFELFTFATNKKGREYHYTRPIGKI